MLPLICQHLELDIHVSTEDLSATTGSMESLSTASKWLKTCSMEHESCRHAGAEAPVSWRPSRLVDLGSGSLPTPKLCDDFAPDSKTEYMTLSRCWGADLPCTLRKTNLDLFKNSIPFLELPQTFQDTTRAVKLFGIRYIWVDALCILQDSVSDWDLESSRTNSIYKYAVCTLAATWGKDSNARCFSSRDPRLVAPCKVRIMWYGKPILRTHATAEGYPQTNHTFRALLLGA